MLSPYDWQESVNQRSQYIEARLRGGSPIIGLAIESGTLLYTYRKNVRKIYEVYDRLMFSGMGQQSDVEALRVTAVDFAHQEGYQRSEADVTIARVVGFALSAPLKRAFGDIRTAPFVIRVLFAEMNETPETDVFMILKHDGDFEARHGWAVVAGIPEAELRMAELVEKEYKPTMSLEEAKALADKAWHVGTDLDESGEPDMPGLRDARPEFAILERNVARERKFRLLGRDECL